MSRARTRAGDGTQNRACSVCKVTFYCNKVCQRAHWKTGHKWVCTLVRTLNKPGAPGTRVDEFTAFTFNQIVANTAVCDEGIAGRGLVTTKPVAKGDILALFVNTKTPIANMDDFQYAARGTAHVAGTPSVIPDALNGATANDPATEAQLRMLCDPPEVLSVTSIAERVGTFARAYVASGVRAVDGLESAGTATLVPARDAKMAFEGSLLLAVRNLPTGTPVRWHYGIEYWMNMAAAGKMPWPVHPVVRWYLNMLMLRGSRLAVDSIVQGAADALGGDSLLDVPDAVDKATREWAMETASMNPCMPSWIHYQTGSPGMHSCIYGPDYEGPAFGEEHKGKLVVVAHRDATEQVDTADAAMYTANIACTTELIYSIWPAGYTIDRTTQTVVRAYPLRTPACEYAPDALDHLYTQMILYVLSWACSKRTVEDAHTYARQSVYTIVARKALMPVGV